MASIIKENSKFKAVIRRNGFATKVKRFLTYESAKEWADKVENFIDESKLKNSHIKMWQEATMGESFDLDLKDILKNKINFIKTSGVYFLILNNEIIYIGMSNHLFRRINQHLNDGKIFDSFYYMKSKLDNCKALESFYIKKFKPKFNVEHTEDKERRKKQNSHNSLKAPEIQGFASY